MEKLYCSAHSIIIAEPEDVHFSVIGYEQRLDLCGLSIPCLKN